MTASFRHRPLCDPSSPEADGITSCWLLDFGLQHNGVLYRVPAPIEQVAYDLYNEVFLPRWAAEVEQRQSVGQPQPLHLSRKNIVEALTALGYQDEEADVRAAINLALPHLQHARYIVHCITTRLNVANGDPYPYVTFEPWDGIANPEQLRQQGVQVVDSKAYVRLVKQTWPGLCKALQLLEYR